MYAPTNSSRMESDRVGSGDCHSDARGPGRTVVGVVSITPVISSACHHTASSGTCHMLLAYTTGSSSSSSSSSSQSTIGISVVRDLVPIADTPIIAATGSMSASRRAPEAVI